MPNHTDTLLHRWFEEVWNKGREDAIAEGWNDVDFLSLYQRIGLTLS